MAFLLSECIPSGKYVSECACEIMKSYPSIHTPAIVLKRSNVGEKDRIITLFTEKHGKMVTIAKGCRDLHSSRLSSLEPGNLVDIYLIPTKSLPILTQVQLVNDFIQTKSNLKKLKQLLQVLEIVDSLSVEEENPEVFARFSSILHRLNTIHLFATIKEELAQLVEEFGFQHVQDTEYHSVGEYVSSLSERPLHSYDFLTIKE